MEFIDIVRAKDKVFYILKDSLGFWGVEAKHVTVDHGKWGISPKFYSPEEFCYKTKSECYKGVRI